jgi:hypothetical protein
MGVAGVKLCNVQRVANDGLRPIEAFRHAQGLCATSAEFPLANSFAHNESSCHGAESVMN